jgi:spermidine/putrescine transport system permease protein
MSRRAPGWTVTWAAAVLAFLHLPLLVLVAFSFNDSKISAGWEGFTLHWYARLLEREDLVVALQKSLLIGLTATATATVFGTLFALGLSRRKLPFKSALEGLLILPVVTPEVVVGISLLVLFVGVGVELGLLTIYLAHVAFAISFVAIVVRARLDGMDPHLVEAALTLGADEWTAFRRVTLPVLAPGIISGALLAFTMSFDDFVITSLVAGPGSTTLPIAIYSMVRRTIEPTVNALSAVVLLGTTLLLVAADRLGSDQSGGKKG